MRGSHVDLQGQSIPAKALKGVYARMSEEGADWGTEARQAGGSRGAHGKYRCPAPALIHALRSAAGGTRHQ